MIEALNHATLWAAFASPHKIQFVMVLLGMLLSHLFFVFGVVTPHKIQGELAKLSFTPGGGAATILAALTEWELNFKLKAEDTTNNDDGGWESKLPGIASWTATAKSIYIEGDATQAAIEAFIGPGAVTTYAAGLPSFTFYPEKTAAGSGENSWVGNGFITDWKLTGKNGSAFAMDITIEGTGPLVKTAQ